jgi:hypothetical protein
VFASGLSEALVSPVAQAINAVSRHTVSQLIETGIMGTEYATTTTVKQDAKELKAAPAQLELDR